jgi:hypothetical protein
MSEQKPSQVKGIIRRAPGEDWVGTQIWGRVPKNVCNIEGPQRTQWPPSFLNGRNFGTIKTLPRAGRPAKLSNWGLGQGGDQEPDGHSNRAPEFLCGDGRTFQKDNHLYSTPPNLGFMVEWPDGSHAAVKCTGQPAQSCQKATECQAPRLEESWHHPYSESWWWQHHAVGMCFSGMEWETTQDQGKDEQSKVQRDP